MAKAKISETEAARQENLEQTISKTDKFFSENKKTLWGILIGAVVIALAVLAYVKFIYQPKVEEAMEQAIAAQNNFQAGNFELALKGDGNTLGFEQVIEDYGKKAGKSMFFYAGLCELQLGNYDSAISYLRKYNGKDEILAARAVACIGDAYVGLEQYAEAAKSFEAAASRADNVFAAQYLFKAGLAYEKLADKKAALKCYKTIEDKYPQSIEAYDIQKYIIRVGE